MSAAKGNQQWSTSPEDPRLVLTQDAIMADLQACAVAYVRHECPDHLVILDMLGLVEVAA